MVTVIDEIMKFEKPINDRISEVFPEKEPKGLYEASVHTITGGGKRLRPAILLIATEAVGGSWENALNAAVSIELMHTFTLVHDDIIDNDEVRRGRPAVHTIWGEAGAIIAGDTMYSKSVEIMADCPTEPEIALEATKILTKTCVEVCEGQWMDIDFETREDVSSEEYIEMIKKKTSVLFGASAQIGALMGGADEKTANALYNFGLLTGLGFQINDDVLDLVTPSEKLGKKQGSDIAKGKRTLLMIDALKKGVKPKAFGKGVLTQEEIDETIEELTKSGSIQYVKELAESYVNQGKAELDILPDSKAKTNLLKIADYMLTRDY